MTADQFVERLDGVRLNANGCDGQVSGARRSRSSLSTCYKFPPNTDVFIWPYGINNAMIAR